jgi:hypothetical protein
MQGGSFNSDLSSPMRENSSTDGVLDDLHSRIKKLERWNTINMVIVTHLLAFRSINFVDLGFSLHLLAVS